MDVADRTTDTNIPPNGDDCVPWSRLRSLAPPSNVQRGPNPEFEDVKGSAPGFQNLTDDIARSLLETRGFTSRLGGIP